MVEKAITRADVESRLGVEVSDAEFAALSSCVALPMSRDAQLDEISLIYAEHIDAGFVVPDTVPQPPEHWTERSRLFLEGLRSSQERALAILNLGDPVSIERLPALLTEVRDREQARGDIFWLHFPSPEMFDPHSFGHGLRQRVGGMSPVLECRRGYEASELKDYLRTQAGAASATPGDLDRARQDWIAARVNRLAQIADLAADITRRCGCLEWEAVAFLLCNRAFELPWIRVTVDVLSRVGLSADAEPWFDVRVFSPTASPEDVAAAYRAARRRWLGGGSSSTMRALSKQEREEQLLDLVAEWEREDPKPSWEERWRRWNARTDIAPSARFKNAESMRVIHARAQRERGKAARVS